MMRARVRRAYSLATVVALACVSGCGDEAASMEDTAGARSSDGAGETGSLSFALRTQSGVEFESFRYAITGPGYAKAGALDVSQSTTVSGLIQGIPAGSGYSITLMGRSVAPATAQCSGSASFVITAGQIADVPVAIACRAQAATPPTPGPAPVPLGPLAPAALALALLVLGAKKARGAGSSAAHTR